MNTVTYMLMICGRNGADPYSQSPFHATYRKRFHNDTIILFSKKCRGGDCFCGERKCEKHPKNQAKFVVVWGGGGNLKLKTDFVMLCFVSVLFVLFGIQLATMNAFVGV